MMIPNIKRVLGEGFHCQTIIEDVNGVIWEKWFDSCTKRVKWRKSG